MTEKSTSIQLQLRDLELFRGLFESRVMTLRQIGAIHFDDHAEAAKKRVQRLKAAGFIRERRRTANEPAVHFLTRKAFDTLSQNGMLVDAPKIGWDAQEKRTKVSDLTLRHELGVMDCKAAMFTAVRNQLELSVVEFSTWPLRIQFRAIHPVSGDKVLVKPDGFIHLEETRGTGKRYFFFLEVDYSTESLDTLAGKIQCYRNFYRQGGFANRYGRLAMEYRRCPFRVLVVCKTAERRNNLELHLRRCKPPIKAFVRLTTGEDFTSDPLTLDTSQAPAGNN